MPDERQQRGEVDHASCESLRNEPLDESTAPKDLKVQIEHQRLIVEWMDSSRSEYSLGGLRRHCPCASCRTERVEQGNNPLAILKSDPTGVRVTAAQLVGKYAIRFFWSDGHDTGIFDFRYLRSLDRAP
jgi:DUF971 family protein